MASERAFKVAKNVIGDNSVRLRPDNLEMNLFLKYNLRALDCNLDDLQVPPTDFRSPNSLNRDPKDSDDDSGDDSILMADSEDKDSEIEFSEGAGDQDD